MKSFGGNFSCDFLTKRYQERVRGRGSTIQTRTICEIVVSHNKIIHQVTVLFVIILSIIFGFVNRQNDKKITEIIVDFIQKRLYTVSVLSERLQPFCSWMKLM